MTRAEGQAVHLVAQVVPLLRVQHLGDRLFDYAVPPELMGQVAIGSVVGIRFGSRNVRGVVLGFGGQGPGGDTELRAIDSVELWKIPDYLLRLATAVADRYLASQECCLRLVVPPESGGAAKKRLTVAQSRVFPGAPKDGAAAESAVEAGAPRQLTTKQRGLLAAIPQDGIAVAEAYRVSGAGQTVLKALLDRRLVHLGPSLESAGSAEGNGALLVPAAGPSLSEEQRQAVEALTADYQRPEFAHRQLWGVTGSGKTEVYLHLAARALAEGAGVILLVPEIALTPLMIQRVRARFGDRVGVLHSGLTAAQRRREYERIAGGEVSLIVGARSAVFAPVADLRLVVIDESHDGSYKQEEAPGYHARAVAEMRLRDNGGLLLEGSASPALESMAHPEACIRLRERAIGTLPDCEVVDMRRQSGPGVLASATREALAQTVRRGEQAIVLLNRRGYSGFVHCDACGHVMMCADCDLSLTYHSQAGRLLCHHCGRSYQQPGVCPECKEAPLVRGGPGTERLVDELAKLVPGERVFRLDSDTVTSGGRLAKILGEFSTSHPAVLVGTQMVAKGHDFADVTLVVVADADTALYAPDFRAAERTFQLLTQVSGRAGRAERPGRVVVQTWNPDVPCIRMALDREDEDFYRRELGIRERLGYPPFTELVRLVTLGEQAARVQRGAQHLVELLSPHFTAAELRGPASLPVLRGKSRWHIVLSAADGERTRAIVGQALAQLREPYRRRGVALVVDVDPLSFM